MTHTHHEDWLLRNADSDILSERIYSFTHRGIDSEGFMLAQGIVLVCCAIISVTEMIGDLSRFLQ